ncbi:hypothetical protein EDC14_1004179 [Hydrogenispora ethanolica]|uniref:Uncharacterized protein n=1 Tax=Hydrogenispora ethanolica TaxID=1082276 RepID=A0A4R1S4U5_HYDET|nr:hypothetical protein [Hydrogenispora ethanolica]TCL74241.1 hypothetical protein EDC14_1004179 [Hydrogenispora ethanolica]
MTYITLEQIEDSLLKSIMKQSDIDEANEQISYLAASKGISLTRIVTPVSVKLRRYAIAYACMIRAKSYFGQQPRQMQMDGGGDAYERKYKAYLAEVEKLENELVVEDFIGFRSKPQSCISIPLARA